MTAKREARGFVKTNNMDQVYDVAVIGGGINGCGIAADAALRGLSVILFEKDDLASKTSSSSSKLIHGGIRYLEYYDFSLVRKALDERQMLLNLAPHLVYSLPFAIPYQQSLRPAWLLRTGLFLYDHLSRKNKLPKSQLIKRALNPILFSPLKKYYDKGFMFYDCCTDDARLTICNALQAKEHGALICTHTEVVSAQATKQLWQLQVKNQDGSLSFIKARSIVNAAGPWISKINEFLHIPDYCKIALIKGSHLVVNKLYEGEHAYLLQNEDKRIVFVIPYQGNSLIGTTDVKFEGDPEEVVINEEEIDYLIKLVNSYFNRRVEKKDIITSWSGVRPLLNTEGEKPQALSRDYVFHFSKQPAPSVAIYGGKITTYRQLARDAIDALKSVFPNLPKTRTGTKVLPGAELNKMSFIEYRLYALNHFDWVPDHTLNRLVHTYGTKTSTILEGCTQISDLGAHFGHGMYEKELTYLIEVEWAQSADDILWRRTKLGLQFNSLEKKNLEDYLAARQQSVTAALASES